MNRFKSKKAIWWSLGLSCLVVGFLAYAIFAPHLATPLDGGDPAVDVPSMQNPPENSGALKLDVQDLDGRQHPPRPE